MKKKADKRRYRVRVTYAVVAERTIDAASLDAAMEYAKGLKPVDLWDLATNESDDLENIDTTIRLDGVTVDGWLPEL